MIKAEITKDSISIFRGESRVDAMVARQETGVDILLNGISISLGDMITRLAN